MQAHVILRSIIIRDGQERPEWVQHFDGKRAAALAAARRWFKRHCFGDYAPRKSEPVKGTIYLDII